MYRFIYILPLLMISLFLTGCASDPMQTPSPTPTAVVDSIQPDVLDGIDSLLKTAGTQANIGEPASIKIYRPQEMYEAINGEADLFLSYDCLGLAVAHFNSGKDQLQVEIFDQGETLNAFGVYSQLRTEDSERIESIIQAVSISGEDILFWKSRYFVRILGVGEEPTSFELLSILAKELSAALEGNYDFPQWTKAMPEDPASLQFIKRDVYGRSYLQNALIGHYKFDSEEYEVALLNLETEEKAATAWDKLRELYKETSPSEDLTQRGIEHFRGAASDGTPIFITRRGTLLLLAKGAYSEARLMWMAGQLPR